MSREEALCLILLSIFGLLHGSDDEFRLFQDLKKNYDSIERPIANHSEAIKVLFKLILQQILEVDARNQVIKVVMWTQMQWTDYKMTWNPEEYGGITSLRWPSEGDDALWKPDILLFNSAQDAFDNNFPVNFVVQYNGAILIAPPGILQSSCNIDITWFPFDEQICCLKYGSWTHRANQVDLLIDTEDLVDEKHQMDTRYYVPNGEWELLGTPGTRISSTFNGEPYVELHYRLHLKRKTLYYVMNWIIPSIIISLNNLLGFMLPSECGEKITLQTTNLLAVTVFLGQVTAVTPTSSNLPMIGIFFSFSMVILGCSVMMTILIINIHFRMPDVYEMNPWVRKVFLVWLPWLLLMKRPGYTFRRPRKSSEASDDTSLTSEDREELLAEAENASPFARNRKRTGLHRMLEHPLIESLGGDEFVEEDNLESSLTRIERLMLQYSVFFRDLRTYLEEDEEEKASQADWRYTAKVVDRLCLFLFTFAILLAFLFLLANTPRAYITQHSDPVIDCSYVSNSSM